MSSRPAKRQKRSTKGRAQPDEAKVEARPATSAAIDVALALELFRGDETAWYLPAVDVLEAAAEAIDTDTEAPEFDEIQRMADTVRRWGARILASEAQAAGAGGSNAESEWMRKVVKSGTLTDRVAALTLQVQTSPIYHLAQISTLVAMACKSNSREAQMSMQGVKDLFVTNLLPDRRMRSLEQQPPAVLRALCNRCKAAQGGIDPEGGLAVAFVFEEELKTKYSAFVAALEKGTLDALEFWKHICMRISAELIVAKPELEGRLLSMLVNKFGDPKRKTAAKVSYQLLQLLQKHPAMQGVVVSEIERFLMRPNLNPRAIYISVIFLNQLVLDTTPAGGATARKLIGVYFSLFERGAEAEEAASTRARNLAKRAGYQKAKRKKGFANEKRRRHEGTSKQFEATAASNVPTRLLCALLLGINRAFPFVGGTEHAKELLDTYQQRLWPLIHSDNFRTSTQALNLLFQAECATESGMPSHRFYRALYARLGSEALRTASRPAVFFNLAYRAIAACALPKSAPALARRKATRCAAALLKRLLQSATHSRAHFTAGSLIITSAALEKNSALRKQLVANQGASARSANRAAERVDSAKDVAAPRQGAKASEAPAAEKAAAGDGDGGYDMKVREPLYCGAGGEPLWELALLERHFNPSVRAFASSLGRGRGTVVYGGDPLVQLTRMAFLDRFAYRKPKQKEVDAARGVEEQKRSGAMGARGGRSRLRSIGAAPTVDSGAFADCAAADVDEHELFMHKFVQLKRAKEEGLVRNDALADAGLWGDESGESDAEEGGDARARGEESPLSSEDDMDAMGALDLQMQEEAGLANRLIAGEDVDDSSGEEGGMQYHLDSERGIVRGAGAGGGSGVWKEDESDVDFDELLDGGEDDDDAMLSSAESEGGDEDAPRGPLMKNFGGARRRGGGRVKTSVFAAAEDFSHLLEQDDAAAAAQPLDKDDFTTRRERGGNRSVKGSKGGSGKAGKGGGGKGHKRRRR